MFHQNYVTFTKDELLVSQTADKIADPCELRSDVMHLDAGMFQLVPELKCCTRSFQKIFENDCF